MTAQQIEPRTRGRLSQTEVELRSPLGQLGHGLEGRFIRVSEECWHGRINHERRRDADHLTDQDVHGIEAIARLMVRHTDPQCRAWGHAILRLAADYFLHDASEDAEGDQAAYRNEAAHDQGRFGASEIEFAFTGSGRHRPAQGRTRGGEQMPLEIDS